MHRKTTGRPKMLLETLLSEEQMKVFAKHPNIFKILGYQNKDAEAKIKGLSKRKGFFAIREDPDKLKQKEEEEEEEGIEEIFKDLLYEQEEDTLDSDSER